MKHTNQKVVHISEAYRHYRRPYPNAADPRYFINKVVDGLLAIVSCMGCVTVFLFLATM